jgi:hypothetical protein
MSRAKTADEVREEFLATCRELADYWAGNLAGEHTCHERLTGFLHSMLCIFDGVSGDLPAFDIQVSPHPDDAEFRRSQGEDWYEPGMVINDYMLHELLYRADLPGVWHGEGRS